MDADTLTKLRAAIAGEHEEYPIHEAVAAYAQTRYGKPITKRDVAALEAAHPGWQFSIKSGDSWAPAKTMTFWKMNEWQETRSSLRIATNEEPHRWAPTAYIKAHGHNLAYFRAAAERNAERAAALSADTGKAEGVAKAAVLVDQIALLHAELKATLEAYELGNTAEYKIREILKEKTGEEFKLY